MHGHPNSRDSDAHGRRSPPGTRVPARVVQILEAGQDGHRLSIESDEPSMPDIRLPLSPFAF